MPEQKAATTPIKVARTYSIPTSVPPVRVNNQFGQGLKPPYLDIAVIGNIAKDTGGG